MTDVSRDTTTDFILLLVFSFGFDTLSLIVGMDDWWYFIDFISAFNNYDLCLGFLPDIFEELLAFERTGDGFRVLISVFVVDVVNFDMSSLHCSFSYLLLFSNAERGDFDDERRYAVDYFGYYLTLWHFITDANWEVCEYSSWASILMEGDGL